MNKNLLVFFVLCCNIIAAAAQSVGVYVGGHIRRERPATISTLKHSGFTYVILFNVNVEPDGTLTTDGETICRDGEYVFADTQPNYVADSSSTLYRNFKALKDALPVIDAVNNDDEHCYDVSSAVRFHVMMNQLGYHTTVAPYTNRTFWQSLVTQLNQSRPGACDRVLIQCYDVALPEGIYSKGELAAWGITDRDIQSFRLNAGFTLHPRPFTLHPRPFTLHPRPFTAVISQPSTLISQLSTDMLHLRPIREGIAPLHYSFVRSAWRLPSLRSRPASRLSASCCSKAPSSHPPLSTTSSTPPTTAATSSSPVTTARLRS